MKELSLLNCRLDGRYDVHTRLGRGSYAEIYIARDILASAQSLHHQVVIKALNVFMQNDLDLDLERTLVENFQNEAIALDRVRHPNVINRLGHGTARDLKGTVFHYLALEYLPGGDLSKFCRDKCLTLSQALFYIEQVCAGLGHAHKSGVIHRDIKPQNLLLTADKQTVKIADFGVARLSHSDTPITRVGTNIYAPPEHSPMLAGQTGLLKSPQLTPAADIYSLAKSAYVLITCESPRFFANQPIVELPFEIRKEPWAKDLLEILNKATQTDSVKRHQDVNEFWLDISRLKKFEANQTLKTKIEVAPNLLPQPHAEQGYNPLAPQKPRFKTTGNLSTKNKAFNSPNPNLVIDLNNSVSNNLPVKNQNNSAPIRQPDFDETDSEKPFEVEILQNQEFSIKRSFFYKFGVFVALLFLFVGALFATQYYIKNGKLFSPSSSSQTLNTGIATTNINLRSEPQVVNGSNHNKIGIVTNNSKVAIKETKGKWYWVDIIEYGEPKRNSDDADSGWVYSGLIKLEN